MNDWVDPRVLLRKHGLQPKRSFGQNFLVAEGIVRSIANACVVSSHTHVLEIGAGLGTLTAALLGAGAERVVAIERDRELVPVLEEEFRAFLDGGRLRLLEADAASLDLAAELPAVASAQRALCGNLPYQITGRLLSMAVAHRKHFDRAVFMVQREVGERLLAQPATEAYGQLSVFVQAAYDVERLLVAKAGCFHPRPQVDSVVLVFRPLPVPRAEETKAFQAVVHAAFGARRKTLRNALAPVVPSTSHWGRIDATGIDLQRRGETLSVEEFARLAAVLEESAAGE